MKQHLIGTTFVVWSLGFLSGAAIAQAPAPGTPPAPAARPSAGSIAVIDLLYIFDNHSAFLERKNALQREKERVESEFLGLRDELKALGDKLKDVKPGSPEYNEYEAAYAKAEADAKVKVQLANKEFIIKEGKMYYQTYQEVLDEIKWYAERAGISMVLRFNGKGIDPDDPQEIVKEMNEQVVYYNNAINITNAILNQINSRRPTQRSPSQTQRPAGPVGARPAPQRR